jgi:hypothetical protein
VTVGNGGRRPQREDAALAALLSEPTIASAAAKAGIGESTLLRWMADPAFRDRYREARREAIEHAVSRLQQAAGKAVDVLVAVAEDRTSAPAARVSAAKTVLEHAFRGLEMLDLAARIEQLERGRQDDATA